MEQVIGQNFWDADKGCSKISIGVSMIILGALTSGFGAVLYGSFMAVACAGRNGGSE